MSRIARLAAVLSFALASLCQPLALDACAVTCEAARAARAAAVAAPCHHTTSCASQITQPVAPGSTVAKAIQAPPIAAIALVASHAVAATHPYYCVPFSSSPPIQLRV